MGQVHARWKRVEEHCGTLMSEDQKKAKDRRFSDKIGENFDKLESAVGKDNPPFGAATKEQASKCLTAVRHYLAILTEIDLPKQALEDYRKALKDMEAYCLPVTKGKKPEW